MTKNHTTEGTYFKAISEKCSGPKKPIQQFRDVNRHFPREEHSSLHCTDSGTVCTAQVFLLPWTALHCRYCKVIICWKESACEGVACSWIYCLLQSFNESDALYWCLGSLKKIDPRSQHPPISWPRPVVTKLPD